MTASEDQIVVCQSNAGERGEVIENVVLFTKTRKDLKVAGVTSQHFKRSLPHRVISEADVKAFNAHCPQQDVRCNEIFHDHFLIVDDKDLCLIAESLKNLGRKRFGFTQMDSGEIHRIKKSALTVGGKARERGNVDH